MSNFKKTTSVPSDNDIRQVGNEAVIIGGLFSRSQPFSTSGSGDGATFAYVNNQDNLVSGTVTSGYQNADLSISGHLQDELDEINFIISNINSYHGAVISNIENLYTASADVILTSSGANDLATAINNLVNGQILEIRTSAVFNPITIPSGIAFKVKVTDGYFPTITGTDCIRLNDGAANIILSSLIIENCNSSYGNGVGSAIGFSTDACKVNDIIFHNITIRNATSSAVMLSYNNRYNYSLAPTLEQMSHRISFVGCHFHKATTDKIEGAALNLRGIENAYIKDCYIDSCNLGRGIHIQDSINTVIDGNYVCNCDDGNGGEGIKIDEIGTISGYRNSAVIKNNIIKRCMEGIDLDDSTSCSVIQNNIVSECSEEGISVDGGIPNGIALLVGNTCYKNVVGIRLESGSTANLKKNVCYNNVTNYLIQNGYIVDDSNTSNLDDTFVVSFSSLIKNDSTISGTTVMDALNEIQSKKQNIDAGTTRPSSVINGQMFFDTNLSPSQPIWYNTSLSGWVNCSGVLV